eukprot:3507562-Pyramimonas_sp.AAC.1
MERNLKLKELYTPSGHSKFSLDAVINRWAKALRGAEATPGSASKTLRKSSGNLCVGSHTRRPQSRAPRTTN